MSVMQALAPYQGQDEISYPALARDLEMSKGERQHIIREGLIKPLPGTSQGRDTLITWDDALALVVAVAIAALAGIAAIAVLRQIRATGAKVTPNGLTILLDGAAS